jgi:hypothetical protein
MIDPEKIIVISYAGGAFGNFLFHVLTEHADNTYKPGNADFEFDTLGRSHNTKIYTPIWSYLNTTTYTTFFPDTDKSCLILCDNGFENDQYDDIRKTFGQCHIVRVCLSERIRPVYWNMNAFKSLEISTEDLTQSHVSMHWKDANEDWAKRENITLHYHNWNYGWQPMDDKKIINVDLEQLMKNPMPVLKNLMQRLGFAITRESTLVELCSKWQQTNAKYLDVYYQWQKIDQALDNQESINFDIQSLHDQGYINYCIERKYNVTIPVYDYRNWFGNTDQIFEMLEKISIAHDPN